MAAMHAVEVADGKRDAIVAGLGKSAYDLHCKSPGRNSEKRPEGFDKPQFYSAAGVAVQRCEQRPCCLLTYLQGRTPFAPTRYQREVESHSNRPRIDLAHHLSIDFQLRAITLLLTVQECFRVGPFVAR
jgi:hypothetical protein